MYKPTINATPEQLSRAQAITEAYFRNNPNEEIEALQDPSIKTEVLQTELTKLVLNAELEKTSLSGPSLDDALRRAELPVELIEAAIIYDILEDHYQAVAEGYSDKVHPEVNKYLGGSVWIERLSDYVAPIREAVRDNIEEVSPDLSEKEKDILTYKGTKLVWNKIVERIRNKTN